MSTSAKSKWRLLRSALVNQPLPEVDVDSKRSHPGFRLFGTARKSANANDEYYQVHYTLPTTDAAMSLDVVLKKPARFNLEKYGKEEFTGFLNTGLMNVWEASHVLAHCLKDDAELDNATVLELGGGMAAVCSLILSKYHATSQFIATDGNPECIVNIKRNGLEATQLIWGSTELPIQANVIIVADCTYDVAFHSALLDSIKKHLLPTGKAVLVAPNRGESLNRFISIVKADGVLNTKLQERYDEQVWSAHMENLQLQYYNTDDHYPLLLELTFCGTRQASSKQTAHTPV